MFNESQRITLKQSNYEKQLAQNIVKYLRKRYDNDSELMIADTESKMQNHCTEMMFDVYKMVILIIRGQQ